MSKFYFKYYQFIKLAIISHLKNEKLKVKKLIAQKLYTKKSLLSQMLLFKSLSNV